MEYQILNRKIKFNKDKSIGKVLYIVEGEKREINLLGMIFKDILGYEEVVSRSRNGKEKYTYKNKKNQNSKIVIINSKESNIQTITDKKFIEEQLNKVQENNKEFVDWQVKNLRESDLGFKYENSAIYYIFDSDRQQDKSKIQELIKQYINSR